LFFLSLFHWVETQRYEYTKLRRASLVLNMKSTTTITNSKRSKLELSTAAEAALKALEEAAFEALVAAEAAGDRITMAVEVTYCLTEEY
jgi:hypothetical protein